ncbi:MAG: nicotinate phosphoribosyltransferase [Actinomycetota bacterium]|jgi:nicotinate phosphoribosyltransferase|nr:nicotinate phosphoribosyltransferase [Actinomycetota bacterium]MDA8076536.1 nicotinate phosphoribosyltransferase [Actinomycetota bacterium]
MRTALCTDHYELTMLDAALRSGVAGHRAYFEVFARELPEGRRYGVVAGVARVAEAIRHFSFGPDELDFLAARRVVSEGTLQWLERFRFSGTVVAYPEGELYFPGSPVLGVEAPFGEAVLLETVVLSILNFDSAVAAAASRMVLAARGRPVIEMGARRTHEQAAVDAARAAYLAGFGSTSDLEAGRRYGIPTAGTVAHAFVLAHASEGDAFAAQLDTLGPGTTLLVDTYDVEAGITEAVLRARQVGVAGPGAIRLDSGDLLTGSFAARKLLDDLGARDTRIVATSDLDEHAIERLAEAPIDAFGVGTRLVTGSGAPTAGFIYKLVAIAREPSAVAPLEPVAKRSMHKETLPGAKGAWRVHDADGRALAELVVSLPGSSEPTVDQLGRAGSALAAAWTDRGSQLRALQKPVLLAGREVEQCTLDAARAWHREALAGLGPSAAATAPGRPALHTVSASLGALDDADGALAIATEAAAAADRERWEIRCR